MSPEAGADQHNSLSKQGFTPGRAVTPLKESARRGLEASLQMAVSIPQQYLAMAATTSEKNLTSLPCPRGSRQAPLLLCRAQLEGG